MVETGEDLFGTTCTNETIHTLAQSYYRNIQHITTAAPSQSVNLELFITNASLLDPLWVDCYMSNGSSLQSNAAADVYYISHCKQHVFINQWEDSLPLVEKGELV